MKKENKFYDDNGFLVIKNLVSEEQANKYKEHFMKLRIEGPKPGDKGGNLNDLTDPLNAFPRFLDMHDWDRISSEWVNNTYFKNIVEEITNVGVKLFRSMVYFKPAGARGVAFHQDERYSETKNLTALWIALDKCTLDNGCIEIVPSSHKKGFYEVEKLNSNDFFTGEQINIDKEEAIPIVLNIGDAVIFDGLTIHGSRKNNSSFFRRAFIIHYERL